MKKKTNKLERITIILLFIIMVVLGYSFNYEYEPENQVINKINNNQISYNKSNTPQYNGKTYIEMNNNIPEFTNEDMKLKEDYYSDLQDKKVRNGND